MKSISLRGALENDFEVYYKIRSSKGDVYWNGYLDKPDKEEFRKIYETRMATSPFDKEECRRNYLIQLGNSEAESVSIGFVQLIKHDSNVEIGYTIVDEYQGLGYGTCALRLGIEIAKKFSDELVVRIRDDNIPSQKIALKNGFVRTKHYENKKYENMKTEVKLRTYVLKNETR
ncbi:MULTISPECIES: GNAT family N-acetyltransferase [Clostridia]|uniref:GNAT family N-acetyltransferase n=1 Tax=Clostridia TaxID=186801 RepID=UPI000E48F3A2|nr:MULTISPECIES: GNAT family N-acetyltransferase [Clostridia]RHV69953.1 N-acetyltransferase [Roseburia sp. OM02-15]